LSGRDPSSAGPHVAYELGMLRVTFTRIPLDGPVDVVDLEGFLLHARNLIEFFWDGAPKGAILPKDFGPPKKRDKDAATADLRDEISQLLSHLTWERVVHERRSSGWTYERLQGIRDAIAKKAQAFFLAIPPDRHAWFDVKAFPQEYRQWMPDA